MTPQKTLEALGKKAQPSLKAWMAGNLQKVTASIQRTTAPQTVQVVLKAAEREWSDFWHRRQRDPGLTPAIILSARLLSTTSAGMAAALDIMKGEGWEVTTLGKDDVGYARYKLAPPAAMVEAELTRRIQRLASKPPLPLPAKPDRQALDLPDRIGLTRLDKSRRALVYPVAGELWVSPLLPSGVVSKTPRPPNPAPWAFRVPLGTRLPSRYEFAEPPEWADQVLAVKDWAPFRNFPVGTSTALDVLKGFVQKDNRYGLSGVCWSGNEMVVTDGNRLHAVYVPEVAPKALDDLTWDLSTWSAPLTLGGRAKDTYRGPGYLLTESVVYPSADFPDYRQAVPSIEGNIFSVTLTPKDLRSLAKLCTGVGERRLAITTRGFGLTVGSRDGRVPEWHAIGNVQDTYGNEAWRTNLDAQFVAKTLPIFWSVSSSPVTWYFFSGGGLGPSRLEQAGVQYHVFMPVRVD